MEEKVYTIKDIAEYVGVSPSTVSRVLSRKKTAVQVTEQTQNKIFAAVKKFKYSPNINARRLKKRQAGTIALVVPSSLNTSENVFADSFLNLFMRGMEEVILSRKYRLLLMFKDDYFVQSKEYLRVFSEGSVDGMLIWGTTNDDAYVRELYGMPALLVGSYYRQDEQMSYIGHDNATGAYKAMRHLLVNGRRKIGCAWGPAFSTIAAERKAGALRAMREFGVTPVVETSVSSFVNSAGAEVMEALVQSGEIAKLDGLFFTNDGLAVGAKKTALDHGLKVPDEFVIAGGDGAEGYDDWLTSFKTQNIEIGKVATQKLFEIIEKKQSKPYRELLPVKLVPCTKF